MNNLKNIWLNTQAVIFDMDGVLIDTFKLHKKAWNSISEKYGFTFNDDEFTKIFGLTSFEGVRSVKQLQNLSDSQLDDFVNNTDARFRELFKSDPSLIKGSIDCVKKIRENNKLTGIGSSAPRENIDLFVDFLSIRSLFNVIISGDDVSKGKPDPEIYLMAAGSLNIKPENCIIFEDSLMGITSAKASGAVCIALTTTHNENELSKADFIIDNFDEFWEMIED